MIQGLRDLPFPQEQEIPSPRFGLCSPCAAEAGLEELSSGRHGAGGAP